MLDLTIHISTADKRFSKEWAKKEVKWADLVARCRKPVRTHESVAQYFAMPKAQQSDIKDVGGFVGGTLKGKRRTKENIASRDLLTLDLDSAQAGFWQVFTEMYFNTEAFIYSTHSHTSASPRLRLVIPFSKTISPDAYEPIARSVAHDLGIEQFDDTTYDPARLMYWPSAPSDGEYVFEYQAGKPLDPDRVLSSYDDWHDFGEWPISSRESKRTISEIRKMEDPLLKDGVVGDFCRTFSIADAIERFLPEIYEKGTAKNRFTYKPGTTANGLVIYEGKYAHAFQSTDPLCGPHSYNAFDLVRLHLFGKYDENCSEDRLVQDRPSYKRMLSFVYEDEVFRAAMLSKQLDEAEDDFADSTADGPKEDPNAWRKELEMRKGAIAPTQRNFILLLDNLPEFKGCIYFDEFEHRVKVHGKLPWDVHTAMERPMSSEDYSLINTYFVNRYGFGLSRTNLLDSVVTVAKKHGRHPVREYLDTLVWDGVPRLDTLFIDFLAATDAPLIRTMTRKHLVAAVKRIYEPGCHYDQVIIFSGDQGTGKSTLIKMLGEPWAKPMSSRFDGRESIEQLAGAWLLESEELRGWRGAELESIKAFFSRPEDRMRPAYGMATNNYPRQCVFFATTNDRIFLYDITGNRRFWPIPVRRGFSRLSPWEDFTKYYKDQVWAEAKMRYQQNETTYLDAEDEEVLTRFQAKFTDTYFTELSSAIQSYLDIPLPPNFYSWPRIRRDSYFRLDAGDDFTATILRDKICYAEIRSELFIGGKFQHRVVSTAELAHAMEGIPGWQRCDKPIYFGAAYGKQRGFIRKQEEDEEDDIL